MKPKLDSIEKKYHRGLCVLDTEDTNIFSKSLKSCFQKKIYDRNLLTIDTKVATCHPNCSLFSYMYKDSK